MVQRGDLATFFQISAQGGVGARDLPEKLAKTGGTPLLSTFWPFWAKVAQTGEVPGHPLGCKVLKKSVTYPMGVSSEATRRAYFVRTVSLVPKYTLRVASELTPIG